MLKIVLTCTLLALTACAYAEPESCNRPEAYNHVDFQIEAGREIANDLLIAQMSAEVQDKQPAQVAQQLNTLLNAALKKSAAWPAVKARSGNHHTYPVYGKNNRIEGWRGNAQLILESRDFKAAGELIAELQATLQLNGLQFTVANDTRQQAENALLTEAIASFGKRADTISKSLDGTGYKLVRLSIGNGGNPYPQPMLARAAMAAAPLAAPEFAGGDTRISVQVSGTIEVMKK